ncbi:MAG: inorganic phosphate transporter [Oscillospiraceae bacterium]|nr:inorganic phosphate transporter [Oscillospiraceae bacterium]
MQILLFFSVLALIFVNGWTDAPNAIAGIVATGGMHYRPAAWMAAACNLMGALLFCLLGGQVARTMLRLSDFALAENGGLCALSGCFLAVVLFAAAAWFWGIPTSESHGLMAGMLGGGLALGQDGGIRWQDWQPVAAGLFLSLGLGFLLGFLLYRAAGPALSSLREKALVHWQRAGAAAGAFMHGGQDGQKFSAVLGLAWALLQDGPEVPSHPQFALAAVCAVAMGLGTLCGGKRIIQKTAMEMVQIDKSQGVAADLSSAGALLALSLLGLPVSTTHTKTAALAGCSAARLRSSVNLSIVRQMLAAWLLTFPLCGLLAFFLTRLFLALL